jgi:hypothetical protein
MMRNSPITGKHHNENENSSSRSSWRCPRGRNQRRGSSQPLKPNGDSGGSSPPPATDGVLVAAKELNFGAAVDASDLRWEDWPKDHIPEGLVRKSASPGGVEELQGSVVRSNFAAGEPLRRDRLIKGPHSGFLAAVLPSGSRAVAINIDTQGSSTAGGFILPEDRVDVIHIFPDEDDARKGQTLLTNIRVLAIGPNFQEKNGERTMTESMQPWNSRRPKPRPSSWPSAPASSLWRCAACPIRTRLASNINTTAPEMTVVRNGRVEYHATGRVEHVVSREQGTGRATD